MASAGNALKEAGVHESMPLALLFLSLAMHLLRVLMGTGTNYSSKRASRLSLSTACAMCCCLCCPCPSNASAAQIDDSS